MFSFETIVTIATRFSKILKLSKIQKIPISHIWISPVLKLIFFCILPLLSK